ncbi:helix-turn-helix transcriptional regulator [Micromonospora sp. NPDC003776]
MSESRLARHIATTIRHERERRELTQQALADLVGLTQGAVAHIERGSRVPSLPMVERLLAAMDVQLTVGVEPLDSHLDAALDALAGGSVVERIREIGLDRMRGVRLEPEEPGEHRWRTLHGELWARMCDELPEPVEVRYGGRSYPVEPLVRVELADPRAADLLRRHRQRLGSAG